MEDSSFCTRTAWDRHCGSLAKQNKSKNLSESAGVASERRQPHKYINVCNQSVYKPTHINKEASSANDNPKFFN